MDRVLQGDRGAFDSLVLRYQDRIYSLAYRMVGSAHEAEDLTQETFLRAHQALGRFRKGAAFYTWLFRIAVNACHSRSRKDVRRKRVEGARLESTLPGDESTTLRREPAANDRGPHAKLEGSEVKRRVHAAIGQLSPDHREVVLLRDFEGFDYDRIAEILEVTKAAIKSRLHRARVELAGMLQDLE